MKTTTTKRSSRATYPAWAEFAGRGHGVAINLRGRGALAKFNAQLQETAGYSYSVEESDADMVDGVLYADADEQADKFERYWMCATDIGLPMVEWGCK